MRGLGYIKMYCPNFLSAGRLTQESYSNTLVLEGHGGGENDRGHPQGARSGQDTRRGVNQANRGG